MIHHFYDLNLQAYSAFITRAGNLEPLLPTVLPSVFRVHFGLLPASTALESEQFSIEKSLKALGVLHNASFIQLKKSEIFKSIEP